MTWGLGLICVLTGMAHRISRLSALIQNRRRPLVAWIAGQG
jgi:hypothetical protein